MRKYFRRFGFLFPAMVLSQITMAASFRALGDLSGGDFVSRANGVSSDGSVVVGFSESAFGPEAFRWTLQGGMVGLGDLRGGDFSSGAQAISADGLVVVGYGDGVGGSQAFRWTAETGMVGLGDLPGGNIGSNASGVSSDGSVIVGTSESVFNGTIFDDEAFHWTADGGMVGLGDLPGGDPFSEGKAVSADGSVVVGRSVSALGLEAYRWTSDTGMVGLGDLAGGPFNSNVRAVTSDGSIIVGFSFSASGKEAYRWTSVTGMVGLGDLPGGQFFSTASDVSDDGAIVVGQSTRSQFSNQEFFDAITWDEVHGMRSIQEMLIDSGIDLTGWALTNASGISSDGSVIVGTGFNLNGDMEAWWADLEGIPGFVPEPTTLTILIVGGLIFGCRRRV